MKVMSLKKISFYSFILMTFHTPNFYGQISYTDIPDATPNATFPLDLNNDGTIDFMLYFGGSGSTIGAYWAPQNNNAYSGNTVNGDYFPWALLAAGPFQKFNESVSFVINCKDQAEVDYYWSALTKNGGQESSCGWCKDKYGLSWQVVPVEYFDLINNPDPKVREKAMKNTLQQKKIIIEELK